MEKEKRKNKKMKKSMIKKWKKKNFPSIHRLHYSSSKLKTESAPFPS